MLQAPSTKRFEPLGTDSPVEGFWGPVTSSLDWCERNYVVTPYVAEFWNTVSNLVLVAVGLVGLLRAWQLKLEGRFYVMGAAIWLVGIGSAAFHGTLLYGAQLLDELPMVYAMLNWIYTLRLMEDKPVAALPYKFVAALVAYGVGWSVVHARFAFTTAFQIQFIGLVLFGLVLLHRCCLAFTEGLAFVPFMLDAADSRAASRWKALTGNAPSPVPPSLRSLQLLCKGYFWFLLVAFALWLTDQFACSALHRLPFGLPNPQLHAWWHVLIGVNCHCGYTFSQCLRQAVVERRLPRTRWHAGLLPLATH